ncbi:MAG: CIA30 family protein [Mycobacterium sp.]
MGYALEKTDQWWRMARAGASITCAVLMMMAFGSSSLIAQADTTNVVLVAFDDPSAVAAWTTINDPVMGGLSTSTVTFGDGGLVFSGTISLDNNGGFASTRGPQDPGIGQRAAGATSIGVRARGDGKTYVFRVDSAGQPWSYIQRFSTDVGAWRTYELPIGGFQAVGMRLDPAPYAPQSLDPSTVTRVSIYILDKQQGPFELTVSAINASV